MTYSPVARILFWTFSIIAGILVAGFWLTVETEGLDLKDFQNELAGGVVYGVILVITAFFAYPSFVEKIIWALVIGVPGTFVVLGLVAPWLSGPLTNGQLLVFGPLLFIGFAVVTIYGVSREKKRGRRGGHITHPQ